MRIGRSCGIGLGMRRNARSITTSPEIVRHIDGLTEANFKLLTMLILWLDANKKRERRFRSAVIHELTRIEAAISLLLVGQEAQSQGTLRHYGYDADITGVKISRTWLNGGNVWLHWIPESNRHVLLDLSNHKLLDLIVIPLFVHHGRENPLDFGH